MLSRIWARLATWIERPHPVPIPGHEYCNERNPCARRAQAAAAPRPGLVATQAAYRVLAPALRAAGLVRATRRADGALVLERTADSPRAVLAAVADGLRALARGDALPPSPAGTRAPAAGWTALTADDADAAAVAVRVAAALRLPPAVGAAGALAVADALDALGVPRSPPAAAAFAASATLPAPAPVVFAAAGTVALEYAGAALATGDFDGDGTQDLVITAYGASPVGTYVDDAVGVAPSAPVANAVLPQAGGWYVRSGGAAVTAAPGPEPLAPAARSTGAGVYARLGQAACVLDFNLDGIDDLALGAPTAGWAWAADPWGEAPLYYYQGRVDIYFGARGAGLPPASAPSATIFAATNLSSFGAVLACDSDISGDGRADLAVGSPMWGPGGDRTPAAEFAVQRGRADVFFAGAAWPARMSASDANFTVLGATTYSWAGASLAGAPDAGAALGVTAREAARVALGAREGESDAAAAARAPPGCAAAAAAALAAPAGAAAGALLLVGSPGFSPSGAVAPPLTPPPYQLVAGRVEAYVVPPAGSAAAALAACARVPPVPLFTVTAGAGLGVTGNATPKLGAAVALGRPFGPAGGLFAALGMPDTDACNSTALTPGGGDVFRTAAGAVAVVALTPALRGDVAWASLPARARLFSALPDARFGLRVGFRAGANASQPDDLVVGAPHYSRLFLGGAARGGGGSGGGPAPTPAGDSGREAGALFLFRGGEQSFPVGDVCAAEGRAAWWAEGAVEHGRLGSAWADYDWDADGARDLVVAAPRAALAATVDGTRSAAGAPPEHAGALQVYAV